MRFRPRVWFAVPTAISLVLALGSAQATKPCPPNPCGGAGGGDPFAAGPATETCDRASRWIAVGRIEKVKKTVHDVGGIKYTAASFDLVVETWEKSGALAPARIAMESRWCFNDPIVLKPKLGKVRVFGRDGVEEEGTKSYFAIELFAGPKSWPSASASVSASASASVSTVPSVSPSASTSASPSVSASASPAPPPSASPSVNPPPRVDPPSRGCACTAARSTSAGEPLVTAGLAICALLGRRFRIRAGGARCHCDRRPRRR